MGTARTLFDLLRPEIEAVARRNPPPLGETLLFIVFRNNPEGFAARESANPAGSQRGGVSANVERKIYSAIDSAIASLKSGSERQHVVNSLRQELLSRFGKWIQSAETLDELDSWIRKADRLGDTSGHVRGQNGIIIVETYFVK